MIGNGKIKKGGKKMHVKSIKTLLKANKTDELLHLSEYIIHYQTLVNRNLARQMERFHHFLLDLALISIW